MAHTYLLPAIPCPSDTPGNGDWERQMPWQEGRTGAQVHLMPELPNTHHCREEEAPLAAAPHPGSGCCGPRERRPDNP